MQQISVFLENKAGRLAEVTKILSTNNINLRAMTIADTADFGILRLIVDDEEKTIKVLTENSFTAKATDVLAVEVLDEPGGLHKIMDLFESNKINIEYLYATLEHISNGAIIVFKVDDIEKGKQLLAEKNIKEIIEL